MTTLEEIERAVERLPRAEFERFREWHARFDAEQFEAKIERDAATARFDALAEAA